MCVIQFVVQDSVMQSNGKYTWIFQVTILIGMTTVRYLGTL